MTDPSLIRMADYDYLLPEEQIAQFPLAERDASRLLISREGQISTALFSEIDRHIPPGALLVFNDTRVIRARLLFRKETGAMIEIFCLEPLSPVTEVEASFSQTGGCVWKCLIGNVKRWKTGFLKRELAGLSEGGQLFAERTGNLEDGSFAIAFHWSPPELTFSRVMEEAGEVPLPPYIHRHTVAEDASRYQTIYARHEGSVAAPTAGLHFTEKVMERIHRKGCRFSNVTLHVGLGTFRPVTTQYLGEHVMHREKIVVTRRALEELLEQDEQPVIAVGTTSARTLESLYWMGVKILTGENQGELTVFQWDPYTGSTDSFSRKEALRALIGYLDQNGSETLHAETQLIIVPGYRFRIVSGLITNFHLPQSTLLLLVAAMTGPQWKTAYRFALEQKFRFLSYGDCCLFFAEKV